MSPRLLVAGLALSIVACGNGTPASRPPAQPLASASASTAPETPEPPDGIVPKLRTGTLEPVDDATVRDLRLVGRYAGEGYEILAGEVPDALAESLRGAVEGRASVAVDFAPGQPTPYAFVEGSQKVRLWIRRATGAGEASVTCSLFVDAEPNTKVAGHQYHFRIGDPRARISDAKVRVEWLRALGRRLAWGGSTPWSGFAYDRLGELADALDSRAKKRSSPRRNAPRNGSASDDEMGQLIGTTTGRSAVREALQQNRKLFVEAAKEKPSIPVASLKSPALVRHPYAAMLARAGTAPPEPLASSAPAEFYYVRAAELPSLFRLMDQVEQWGSPAANLLDRTADDRLVALRYETALGLRRGPLTRALGPAVIGEVALVGSDPYVKEGSDLTVILRVKNRLLFDAALAATQADLTTVHGAIAHETRQHGGVEVAVARSADGAVRQERASVGDLELVSNSPAAIDIVLDTCHGRHPRLADEPDFQFMLARDAQSRADILAYMGDRFVGEVVGPKQKVLEARRELALAELQTPGMAALLYGIVQGKSPTRLEDLFGTSLLAKNEMNHASGGVISWQPGGAARSSWGTPAALVSLLDLPAPALVTASERAGYERFARYYQESWSAYIDPVALRIAFDKTRDGGQTMTVDLRELPLIDDTQYHEVAAFVGDARFALPGRKSGARLVAGIGRDAEPRRDLERTLRGFSGSRHKLKFDWVGEWASIGVADRSELASLLLKFSDDELPQLPEPHEDSRAPDVSILNTLPLYAEVAVKSKVELALTLAGLRVMAEDTIPGMFDWGEVARHRDVPIVRIGLKKELVHGLFDATSDAQVFYAVTSGALVVTLQQWLLERLIDEQLDGTGPATQASTAADSAQLAFELGSTTGKGLWTTLGWLLEKQLIDASARTSGAVAEALLRGAPEIANDPEAVRALGLSYLGAAPTTPDGASYVLAKEGVRDPARGTSYAPVWPDVPVAGSPVAKVMQSLSAIRTEISFDDEGKDGDKVMRSLHARAAFDLRPVNASER